MTISRALKAHWPYLAVASVVGLLFFWLHHPYYEQFDYTFRLATAILHGHIGISENPSWLNELVPGKGGEYYSVFPLGAVLSVLPGSWLVMTKLLHDYPMDLTVWLVGVACGLLAYGVTGIQGQMTVPKRLMLALWLVIGTWFMPNLLFAGAWQLALGFAVLGELGAIYFVLVRPNPWLAGLFLAMAFGNRTEIILTAPILMFWLWQSRKSWTELAKLCAFPVVLGIDTLAYNYGRFGRITDFGYAHIPGVLNEPWYQHGIFSLQAIPGNAHEMLTRGYHYVSHFPYVLPTGFGGSILLASPFLLLLLRRQQGNRVLVIGSWLAVAIITLMLWLHGNPGGWQFSYRYAVELLPWLLIIFTQILPLKIRPWELGLFVASVAINIWATYLFIWTSYVTP
jgi:hypothetical protein